LPGPLAALVSAAFDGAAICLCSLSLTIARSHDSAFAPRLGVLLLAAISAWLNSQHASLLGLPLPARVLYASPPIVAILVFDLNTRFTKRAALRKAGKVPASLPPIGRTAALLFPIRSYRVVRSIIRYRLTVLENQAGMSQVSGSIERVSETFVSSTEHKVIRTWARTQGISVPERGPLPKAVVSSYLELTAGGSNGNSNGHAPEYVQGETEK
jgi:hypothetical protein